MQNREEIEKLATEYAQNEDSCYTNDFNGYLNGYEACREKIAEIIDSISDNAHLGKTLRELFKK